MRTRKRLTLLRHAKAVPAAHSMPDRDRPLNDRGERDARLIGQRLREAGARPSLLLTSPAVRTMQTSRLVAREIGYPLEFLQREADLYLAAPADILAVLARQDDSFNDVIICAHNPGLTELLEQLAGSGIDNLPTCGIASLEAPIRCWRDLCSAELVRLDSPALAATEAAGSLPGL